MLVCSCGWLVGMTRHGNTLDVLLKHHLKPIQRLVLNQQRPNIALAVMILPDSLKLLARDKIEPTLLKSTTIHLPATHTHAPISYPV